MPETADATKILRLRIKNIGCIRAVEITPDGNVVRITGPNAAGKSTVLDSISMLLCGSKLIPQEPVRAGTSHGEIEAELGKVAEDIGVKVVRKFTSKGNTYLEVTDADSRTIDSPQTFLNRLRGNRTFSATAFAEMSEREQLESLKELAGLDFTELEADREATYAKRTEINRDCKRLESQLAGLPSVPPETPDESVSVERLSRELSEAHEKRRENDRLRSEAATAKSDLTQLQNELDGARRLRITTDENTKTRIAHLQAEIDRLRLDQKRSDADSAAEIKLLERDVEQADKRASTAQALAAERTNPDTSVIQQQIADAEATNGFVRTKKQRATLKTELNSLKANSDQLSHRLEEIDEQKSQAVASAKMPVDGLGFTENGVTLNGHPFSQASSAEQLTVSVAMGIAQNPQLRVMTIHQGSMLDKNSFTSICEMANKAQMQVWLEQATDGEDVGIRIEDGAITNGEATE